MSRQYSYVEDLLATVAKIGELNEQHVLNKINFQNEVRLVCNNECLFGAPVDRHAEGEVVEISGDRYVSHYVGGYHYFQLAD